MNEQVSSGGMTLLPAKPGTCAVCATKHDEAAPHNYWSIFYGMRFKMAHGRDATHADCCAHMPENGRAAYRSVLGDFGKKWTDPPAGYEAIAEPADIQPER